MSSQPVGPPVHLPQPQFPSPSVLHGRTVRLERLRPDHAHGLYPFLGDGNDQLQRAAWAYYADGPFHNFADFQTFITSHSESTDPYFFAIVNTEDEEEKVTGYISLLSIVPSHYRLEIGHVLFAPTMQRTTGATEAIYLLLKYAFEAGYRRVEWKCNSLNEGSARAAKRFGFTYEGLFRQHMVVKGRNRDSMYFSMLREEWDRVRRGMEAWLDKGNFDAGRQKKRLEECMDL
ncbi:hypothetical protein EYZ11_000269 [Aspergillus tanneri]|uniref:N-acetyltransferase domain-containing protein n=1 Tax=Aspergillus tanneri TaxID=1220188 RepID=A0A4S3JXG1_9EURO|nr:uncharacterized protein ATNIH1004_007893 [Aspergillus tanneri]KAA8646460.1 hypothetical protein ATNIH1004_007893 [Aspergillus tanneri]THD00219.1 hypothetical protein EYZ11_000269 [Aspergillus tanneri]